MSDFFDNRERRDPREREQDQMASLPDLVRHAKTRSVGFSQVLSGVEPGEITDRAALARLPVTRKSALKALQADQPPLAGLTAVPVRALARLYRSPGPITDCDCELPEGQEFWRMGRALYAAGFRRGDIVHNAFSYHFTPAGRMFEEGAHACGCVVFPAGTGNTEGQVEAIQALRADGYAGVPDFLRIIVEKADELGVPLPSLKKACVSGGPLFPAVRQMLEARGIRVTQCYGTADLGLIAYETPAREGLVADEDVLIEIVRPGTGDPVPDGEVGEVVVTSFNPAYPLIRFGTGDLSAVLAGQSPCGRTNLRIKGWMGRADQTAKVKGMFVHPEQVAAVLARHGEIKKARLVIDRDGDSDAMTLHCEVADAGDGLADRIADSVRAACQLKGAVTLVAPGSLPNDGKVIDDVRSYD